MEKEVIDQLYGALEDFLRLWTEHMRAAGYLAHTTARREDCIESFFGVMDPLRKILASGETPGFYQLLNDLRGHADFVVSRARTHRQRGVTAEMYFGCFKTLIHSLEEIVAAMALPEKQKWVGLLGMRRVFDMLETASIGDWSRASTDEQLATLQQVNRHLTLAKNRYENIFEATSDLVLVVDPAGYITEANPEACRCIGGSPLDGEPVWEVLDLPLRSVEELLAAYPPGSSHEVPVTRLHAVFALRVVPFSQVSLATHEVMVILNDITLLVDHRQELEKLVAERTAALTRSKQMLRREKTQTDEMNVTLKNVMRSIESDRQDFEQTIARRIRNDLLPALEKVGREPSAEVRASYLDLIRDQLISLTGGSDAELDAGFLKLSKTEAKICRFIQSGASTKEICEALSLAFDTVQTHRRNIRRKLGLHGKSVNLHAYLTSRRKTLPAEED